MDEETEDTPKVACYYYLTESGKAPVRDFIDSLDVKSQGKFFFVRALLQEFGYRLPFPHARYIGNDIFELRFKKLASLCEACLPIGAN